MLYLQRSAAPLTEFAPTWNIPFWTAKYDKLEEVDIMRAWIIKNEQKIIDKYADMQGRGNDGGTGLGMQSLTAQYSKFNLFTETQDIPEFQRFFKFLRSEYSAFMKELRTEDRKCSIYSWANVVRPGQDIKRHNHGGYHFSYLSGNMHFDDYKTITTYYHPYDIIQYDMPNVKGGVTFFPSYIFHGVNSHTEDGKRVSMAFDIFDTAHLKNADFNSIEF